MRTTFLTGPAGTGKTTQVVARLRSLLTDHVPGHNILVLLPQLTLASPYRDLLRDPSLPGAAAVDILTFSGLALQTIDLFWPLVAAPAGFGRRHVAPLVARFRQQHADVTISLNLSDRVVDLAGEGFDCAVRVGDLPDSSLVSVRLADNRRLCVATPAYLQRRGVPAAPADLVRHDCLVLSSDASQTRGWAFSVQGEVQHVRLSGPLDCSDGQVLHDWCLAGYGIAWRSTWEVQAQIATGALVEVLQDFAAPPNGIYAVFPQRKHLPLRLRLWIDFLKHHYAQPDFWRARAAAGS